MWKFSLKRLLLAFPTLVLLSMVAFFLSRLAPGDPVLARMQGSDITPAWRDDPGLRQSTYQRMATELGYDLPVFYFTIKRASIPDTLYRILPLDEQHMARSLIRTYGNWDLIQQYRTLLSSMHSHLTSMDIDQDVKRRLLNRITYLRMENDLNAARSGLEEIRALGWEHPAIPADVDAAKRLLERLATAGKGVWDFVPSVEWYGTKCQYHRWISRILAGDFGKSAVDGRQVWIKLSEALRWTLFINIPTILLAFGIAIPLGVAAARRKDSLFDKTVSSMLFALYAMPSFWLATLFVVFLTTPDYGAWTDLFPSQGLGNYRYASGPGKWGIIAWHLILPVVSLTLGTLAYLFRQMRQGMLTELSRDYVVLARAKGLSEKRVHWRHVFPNALFPMITIVGGVFPAAISGSVIIEVIFNIPGMGRLLYMSILAKDWNVVFASLLLAGFLTILGYLVADLLYATVDPRVRLANRGKSRSA